LSFFFYRSDFKFTDQIAKLLRFDSSTKPDELVSLDDYVSRCDVEQKEIYYLVAPSRVAALNSPYYETFKKHGKEVLFLYHTIDDFVMNNLKEFGGRKLVSAETSSVDLEKKTETAEPEVAEGLTDLQGSTLCSWIKLNLGASKV
jgi:HSP90 family molecular chaperone